MSVGPPVARAYAVVARPVAATALRDDQTDKSNHRCRGG